MKKKVSWSQFALMALISTALYACGGSSKSSDGLTGDLSLSGSIYVSSAYGHDSDTVSPDEMSVSNNTFDQAQALDIIGLSGYLGGADQADYFLFNMDVNDVITVRAYGDNDIDIELFDSDRSLVDASNVDGSIEQLSIQRSGEYFVKLTMASGVGNYYMEIDKNNSSQAVTDIVPGDIIVKYHDQDKSHDAVYSQSAQVNSQPNMPVKISIDTDAFTQRDYSQAQGSNVTAKVFSESYTTVDDARERKAIWNTWQAIKQYRADPAVAYAEPNYIYTVAGTPGDPDYDQQRWHYEAINLPEAWDISTGEGVEVAVLDNGFDLEHDDLRDNFLSDGYDFSASGDDGLDLTPGIDSDPSSPALSIFPHGTHVAGTIAAASGNDIGGVGVAYNAKILPIRIGEEYFAELYDVAQGVLYAAGLANDSGVIRDKPVDIINMSLGGDFSIFLLEAIRLARLQGVIIVASAGNDNLSVKKYPAAYPEVIAVSAVDINSQKASYSNFGPWVNIAAPGGDTLQSKIDFENFSGEYNNNCVYSTIEDNQFEGCSETAEWIGTSMASPHVAGVIALMESVYKSNGEDLTPALMDRILYSNENLMTQDLGESGRDNIFGQGLIDAQKAVSVFGVNPPEHARLSFDQSFLNFGATVDSLLINVTEIGGGKVESFGTDAEWITITEEADNQYRVSIDRQQAAASRSVDSLNVYSHVYFSSEYDKYALPLNVFIQDNDSLGDVGALTVELIDVNPLLEEPCQVTTTVVDAADDYQYQLSRLEPGNYAVRISSDYDNNGDFCGDTEYCGFAFPENGLLRVENVANDIRDRQFLLVDDRQVHADGNIFWGFDTFPVYSACGNQ